MAFVSLIHTDFNHANAKRDIRVQNVSIVHRVLFRHVQTVALVSTNKLVAEPICANAHQTIMDSTATTNSTLPFALLAILVQHIAQFGAPTATAALDTHII